MIFSDKNIHALLGCQKNCNCKKLINSMNECQKQNYSVGIQTGVEHGKAFHVAYTLFSSFIQPNR